MIHVLDYQGATMEMTEGPRVVLDLLVGEAALATAGAWEDALSTRLASTQDGRASERDVSPRAALPLIDAVDMIVPHLSDYKTFYENLSGLLKFCEQEYSSAHFNVVCKWLAASSTSIAFRHWLYAYADRVTDAALVVDARQWKQALLAAALQEPDERLRVTIFRLIDQRIGSLVGVVDLPPSPPNEAMRLLLFYWEHAEQLSQSSVLCAAKFVALTREAMAPTEDVLALLRWGRVLQPLFFENFVDDLLRLQALRRPADLELQVPMSMIACFRKTATIRVQVQNQLEASQQQIRSAEQRKAKHLYRPTCSSADWATLCTAGSVDVADAVHAVSSLRADLAVLPSKAFPPVFAAFAMSAATLFLQDSANSHEALPASQLAIESLLDLLVLRVQPPILRLVLAAIIDLQLASLSIWRDDPPLFKRCIGQLSESVILELDCSKRWILQAALHHLVLESDVAVLIAHASILEEQLPHETYNVVRLRMANA
jgi:hypothetical protein